MNKGKNIALAAALTASLAACVAPSNPPPAAAPAPAAGSNPMVGGAVMRADRPILDNAAASREHGVLVAAVRAAGLAGTLSGAGAYTLFAPSDAAFARLPPLTVETLMEPANRTLLSGLLNYHLVPGRKTRADIAADIRAGGGTASYRTLSGSVIRLRADGAGLAVYDANNRRSMITQSDVFQSNGVFHVVDTVLLPTVRAG